MSTSVITSISKSYNYATFSGDIKSVKNFSSTCEIVATPQDLIEVEMSLSEKMKKLSTSLNEMRTKMRSEMHEELNQMEVAQQTLRRYIQEEQKKFLEIIKSDELLDRYRELFSSTEERIAASCKKYAEISRIDMVNLFKVKFEEISTIENNMNRIQKTVEKEKDQIQALSDKIIPIIRELEKKQHHAESALDEIMKNNAQMKNKKRINDLCNVVAICCFIILMALVLFSCR